MRMRPWVIRDTGLSSFDCAPGLRLEAHETGGEVAV